MTPGWDWSQIIVIAVIAAVIWLAFKIAKVIGKTIMAIIAVVLAVYLGQSLGWWTILPFDCPSPSQLWNIIEPWIQAILSRGN